MMTFEPLTEAVLAGLEPGTPIFFRGPEGQLSVMHVVLGQGNVCRPVVITAEEAPGWAIDLTTARPGTEATNPTSGTNYRVTALHGEGTTGRVALSWVGTIPLDKLPLFSLEPGLESK